MALTPIAMKCFERLVRSHMCSLDPLKFAYQANRSTDDTQTWIVVDDSSIHILYQWVLDFLTEHPQVVRMGKHTSPTLTLSTGAPHCVLSPLLYSLYIIDCTAMFSSKILVKFTNNTVVVSLMTNNEERAYLQDVENLIAWYQANNLSLNTTKTKEMVVDFSKKQARNCTISRAPVYRVSSFKHFGVHLTEDLS